MYADDLHMAALNLGDVLPAMTRAFADIRDRAVRDGLGNQAAFYAELSAFLADTRDHYRATLTDFQHDYLDDLITVVPEQ